MFVPVPTIFDFNAFNKRLLEACENDMNRPHYHKDICTEPGLMDSN